jgi:hypothetical protein
MGGNDDGLALGDDPAHLLAAMLDNETAKTAEIDVLATGQGVLDHRKEAFQGRGNFLLVYPGLLRNLKDHFCFGHGEYNLLVIKQLAPEGPKKVLQI